MTETELIQLAIHNSVQIRDHIWKIWGRAQTCCGGIYMPPVGVLVSVEDPLRTCFDQETVPQGHYIIGQIVHEHYWHCVGIMPLRPDKGFGKHMVIRAHHPEMGEVDWRKTYCDPQFRATIQDKTVWGPTFDPFRIPQVEDGSWRQYFL